MSSLCFVFGLGYKEIQYKANRNKKNNCTGSKGQERIAILGLITVLGI
jgi:hypothetical protein